VTAKQALRDVVEALSEQDASRLLALYDEQLTADDELSDDEVRRALAGERQISEGDFVSGEQLERNLGR
jgi:hypothetical protein